MLYPGVLDLWRGPAFAEVAGQLAEDEAAVACPADVLSTGDRNCSSPDGYQPTRRRGSPALTVPGAPQARIGSRSNLRTSPLPP